MIPITLAIMVACAVVCVAAAAMAIWGVGLLAHLNALLAQNLAEMRKQGILE